MPERRSSLLHATDWLAMFTGALLCLGGTAAVLAGLAYNFVSRNPQATAMPSAVFTGLLVVAFGWRMMQKPRKPPPPATDLLAAALTRRGT